jgi:lipoprotein-releasing system ATP-binding protein
MLVVTDLHKIYSMPAGPLPVLQGVSFQLAPGEALAVMGPSGSGKSTLLHVLGVLDRPTSGSMTLQGEDPFSLDERAQAQFRNANVGFVFQDHCLLPQLSVIENVLVPLLVGAADPGAEGRATSLLEEMGLAERLNHKPAELSGGEKQRVAIARALIREPKLLLCDEPTGNLDRKSAALVADALEKARRSHHACLVVVTHSQELAEHFPRQAMLRDGHLVEQKAG